jgi:hypothetical protein
MAVDIDTSNGFRASRPHLLSEAAVLGTEPLRNYDVSPDGQRFLMVASVA